MLTMSSEFNLDEIIKVTGGSVLSTFDEQFKGVGTDTRFSLTNQIFIALKGDNFDAHNYLPQAHLQGAKALIIHDVTSAVDDLKKKLTIIKVNDTLKALQDLGHYWRSQLMAKIIAISGSNGKTSTKEFTHTILSTKFKSACSQGSYNNHWGVPMTLLSFSKTDEVGIVEMGMNHSGELTALAKIAVPDICLITMVGQAHIGELGSQKAVANAKEELYLASPEAHQIYNTDNEHTLFMYERARERLPAKQLTTFSSYHDEADVSLRAEKVTLHYIDIVGKIGGVSGRARVPIYGRQNVVNLMGASAIALLLEMDPKDIWQALPLCKSHWGRNQLVKIKKGTHVLFDGYNANPESMAAGIKNLYELSCEGQKVVILGEMMEMGKNAPELHRQLGEMVGNTDVDLVWFMGPHHKDFEAGLKQSLFRKTYYISDTYEQTLAIKILSVLNQQDIVFIKGSRGMRLERALQEWEPINFD